MPSLEEVDDNEDSDNKDLDIEDDDEGPAESTGAELSGFS